MRLPSTLQNAIEQEAASLSFNSLRTAAAELSDRYRRQQHSQSRFITTEAHRLAYAATRMPATFAAMKIALTEVRKLAPDLRLESLLDLGAGTGAASWAAIETFDQLQRITLIEQDKGLIELGRRLVQASDDQSLRSAEWQSANLKTAREFPSHDLVMLSYSLGEIEAAAFRTILQIAWRAANQALIIVEPGTMKGFQTILAARTQLIEAGAFVIAPCPHQQNCPMSDGDWCHFAARFDRSALHRRLKGGTMGYEDEKFSYLAVAKTPGQKATARVLRHPLRQAGFTQIQLCTDDGIQTIAITKRDKANWKRARKTDWGDAWDIGPASEPANETGS